MKIRNGFVSNSSSSSFCMFGAYIDDEILKKSVAAINEDYSIYDVIDDILQGTGLSWSNTPEGCDSVAVGRSFTSIKDTETGAQFKDSVRSKMKELFGDKIECNTMEESWMDN